MTVDCPACGADIADPTRARGIAINRRASTLSEAVIVEEQIARLPKSAPWTIRDVLKKRANQLRAEAECWRGKGG